MCSSDLFERNPFSPFEHLQTIDLHHLTLLELRQMKLGRDVELFVQASKVPANKFIGGEEVA